MAIDLALAPKTKRPKGEPCSEPVVFPDIDQERAARLAEVAKALGDPIRLQLVDVLRQHAGKVCVCELVPLFDIAQPTLSHHLKKLRAAGIVDSERPGSLGVLLRAARGAGRPQSLARLNGFTPIPRRHRDWPGNRNSQVLRAISAHVKI